MVRTHVIGHVRSGDVQRSDRHAGYGSGRMAARSFLILHGLEGSGPGHWQTWLTARLRADAERVAYPDLPDADLPSLHAWREALNGELAALPDVETVVVCHSLACLLYLHHVDDGGAQADRVLLVAPPSEGADIPQIAAFFPAPLPALRPARGSSAPTTTRTAPRARRRCTARRSASPWTSSPAAGT